MPDTINAKATDSKFAPHPEGQFIGQCVDTIDLGERVETFTGKPAKLAHKCAIVFRTGQVNQQTSQPIDIAREFTVSMGDLANLRKFLEQWRGKPYTPAQINEGVPLHKLAGQFGLLSVSHKESGNGRTYANITACVGVPEQLRAALPTFGAYTRDEYWETKKKGYADEAKKFRAEAGVHSADEFDEYEASHRTPEDDDLPF